MLYSVLGAENLPRQRIEKALQESKALAGGYVNRSGSWTRELASGVLTCSAGIRRLFGFDPATLAVPLQDFLDRIHPEDRQRVRSVIAPERLHIVTTRSR